MQLRITYSNDHCAAILERHFYDDKGAAELGLKAIKK